MNKKNFIPILQWIICTTLNCVGLIQFRLSSIKWIILCNVGLKCFFYLFKCLILSLDFSDIYILQGSVETYFCRGRIYLEQSSYFSHWSKQFACIPSTTRHICLLLLSKTVVNCNVASASVSLHTFSFMALYKFVFNFNLITLLQIVCRVCQWKNFENRSINGLFFMDHGIDSYLA